MSSENLNIMPRDYRFFEAARKAAEESDFKTRVGAVAVYRRRVIASAASQNKTHSMQKTYNRFRNFNQVGMCMPKLHAEIALLAKLKKMDVNMRDVSVYVYRICKSKAWGMARPCDACYRALRDAGVERVYYTTNFGVCLEVITKRIG